MASILSRPQCVKYIEVNNTEGSLCAGSYRLDTARVLSATTPINIATKWEIL